MDLELPTGNEEEVGEDRVGNARGSSTSSGGGGEVASSDASSPDGIHSPQDYCQQVFSLCDPEGKGFITRETLATMCDRRNSVLDSIMSTLDHDKDGRISYDEFQEGFQSYSHDFLQAHGAHMSGDGHEQQGEGVGDQAGPLLSDTMATGGTVMSTPLPLPGKQEEEDVWESDGVRVGSGAEGREEWVAMAGKIDPDNLLRETEVGRVWSELADRDPSLLEHFERFLSGVAAELKQSQHDKEKLQTHMKRVMDQHNREVTEMEDLLEQHLTEVHEDHQIKSATKTQLLSSRFHTLLAARDQVIHQLVDKEDLLKKELLNKSRSEERLLEEKEGLLQANSLLKDQLDRSIKSLSLKRRLVGKPSMGRSVTVDSPGSSMQDSMELRQSAVATASESSPVRYFPPKKSSHHMSPPSSLPRVLSQELAESEQSSSQDNTPQSRRKLFSEGRGEGEGEGAVNFSRNPQFEGFESHPSSLVITKEMSEALRANLHMELSEQTPSPRLDERDETHDPPVTPPDSHMTNSEPSDTAISHLTNDILTYSSQVAMTAPDSTASVSQSTWLPSSRDILRPTSPMAVNRVFKVVFLGDSGVGKTSLIVRVSQGQFTPVHSTLGLDFTTKTLIVGEERVVFQLWDTAGQERFHSALTSVYFRRADAFVIVYDVTNRNTFKNVRSWLSIITASLREHPPVLMLVGNKCDNVEERRVTSEEGRQLALDLHGMFSEMSALSGTNVVQAHQTLASLLLARENEELEKARKAALDLSARPQKRKCFC